MLRMEEEKSRKRRVAQDKARESTVKRHSAAMKEFQGGTMELVDMAWKAATVGLVTREEFQEKQIHIHREEGPERNESSRTERMVGGKSDKKKKNAVLSFAFDDDEENEDEDVCADPGSVGGAVVARLGKDPSVQTDFLPDRDKELEEERLRTLREEEQKRIQDIIRNEPLSITYSYFNGSGHRRSVTVRKGDTILQFLKCVQGQLKDSFREIKSSGSSDLMYIKEDVILPHTITFYELITNKARGRSGPLFRFDVQEHVTMAADCRLPPKDSHAGKVVERHWYLKNKHIHPFNKWEPFDPQKHYTH